MPASENVIDLTLARKRRQARLMAQAMWNLYLSRMNMPIYANPVVLNPREIHWA